LGVGGELAPEDKIKIGSHVGPTLKKRATEYNSEGGSATEIARTFLMAGMEGISAGAAYDQFTAAARVQSVAKATFTIERRYKGGQCLSGNKPHGRYSLSVIYMGDRRKQVEEECDGYPREEVISIFAAILEKRTTSKRRKAVGGIGASDKLLNATEVAARFLLNFLLHA